MRLPRFTLTVCLLATAFLAIPQFSVSTSSTVSAQILDFTNDPPEPELQAADFFVDCDELVAAAEAKENGTIVSGIEVEGSVPESPVPLLPTAEELLAFFGDGFAFNGFTPLETLSIAIPSGTLELVDIFGDFETLPLPAGFTTGFSFMDEVDLLLLGPGMFFTPDPELGTAFGFCVSGAGFSNEGGGLVVFDGEEIIAQFEFPGSLDPASFTFIAEPGQTVTSIAFFNALLNDFQVGFCEPEPPVVEEISNQDCFAAIAVEVGALADAATDSEDAYALNLACAALHFAAKDKFYEEGGNRLSSRGSSVFTAAAYAICYLEHTGVEGTEDIVDRIIAKLDQIVDEEIDFAIENGGRSDFIERAEDLAEAAEWIDTDLDNPLVATIAYKLAWANAYLATY